MAAASCPVSGMGLFFDSGHIKNIKTDYINNTKMNL